MTEFLPAPSRVPVHFVFSAALATWRLRHAEPTAAAPRSLQVVGDFDLAAVDRFAAVAADLTGGEGGDVTVDLSGVRFIDAAGLGALVLLRNRLVAGGHALHLQGPDARVRRVFTVAGLAELLPAEG